MKRDGDILSMFQKHAAKKHASSSVPIVEEQNQVEEADTLIEEIVDPSVHVQPSEDVLAEPTPAVPDVPPPTSPLPPSGYDVDRLPYDPGERLPIASYHANDQDVVRRAYILRGSFQPYAFLEHTNELSECLQRREQDIIHAIQLIGVAKNRMQHSRSNGWDQFLQKVTLFCNKHGVQVPDMEANYVPYGRSRRFVQNQTNDDHFRREVYIGVIDKISQELDNRFDEVNLELLSCMSALNPSNSFASFDAQKVRRLAEFYPKDIFGSELLRLELQLDTYIDVMRQDDRFSAVENLVDLSVKLVETNRHKVYDLVYLLIKLVLLLPVATASVERAFSGMDFVKTKRRNKMADSLLDDCLVTFIEKDILNEVDEDDVIKTFMAIRKRRPKVVL